MDLNKEEFFEKYAHCAEDNEALDFIYDQYLKKTKSFEFNKSTLKSLDFLIEFPQLEILVVEHTSISDLTPLKHLNNLEKVDVFKTKITDLRPFEEHLKRGFQIRFESSVRELGVLNALWYSLTENIKVIVKKKVREIILSENGLLENPPKELAKKGNDAIFRYWKERDRVGATKINEARLLLVGQGGAGKTTLRIKLKDKNAPMPLPEETTIGIKIDDLKFKPNLDDPSVHFEIEEIETKTTQGSPFTVKVWDFGGQNIQHYAHQFFMSDSVVYAVLSNTREQNTNFQYWLNIIELLGKDSPFFIVQNEREGHKEPLRDVVKIQERFPDTFQSVEQVNLKDAATDWRFEVLKEKLLKTASQLPHTQREVLTSFFNVRQKLEGFAQQQQQTITFREFQKLCGDEGIEDRELMKDYARLMTELGIALHFHDDRHLNKYMFLNPKWIIDALFELLYYPSVIEQNKGHFSIDEARQIWSAPEYAEMDDILLDLMVKFRLCYEVKRNHQYIVPQRLPARETAFVPPADATHLIYKYKFLPSGLLTQLTCSLHELIEGEKVWSDAVQFVSKNGNGRVFGRENSEMHLIELFGMGNDKAELLNRVVDALDAIHAETKLKNLVVEKFVPCPCTGCQQRQTQKEEPHFYKYEVLKSYFQEDTAEKIRCEKSTEKLLVAAILQHANIRTFRFEEIQNLVGQNRLAETLKILRGLFPQEKELILQESRYNQLGNEDRIGVLRNEDNNFELVKLRKDILSTAEKLLKI